MRKYDDHEITITINPYEKQLLIAAASMFADRGIKPEQQQDLRSVINKLHQAKVVQQPRPKASRPDVIGCH